MQKHPTKVIWGVRIVIASLLLLASLAVIIISTKPIYAETAAMRLYPTQGLIPLFPTSIPTIVITPKVTQVPTPTPKPQQPQPTQAPPTPAPTAHAVIPPPVQQALPTAASPAASTLSPRPRLVPSPTPAPTSDATPGPTMTSTPLSTKQQNKDNPIDAIFGPIGVTIMMLSILGAAGAILLFMRYKQLAPGATARKAVPVALSTPMPQGLPQSLYPATPMPVMSPAMMQPETALAAQGAGQSVLQSSAPSNWHSDPTEEHIVIPPMYAPGEYSPLMSDHNMLIMPQPGSYVPSGASSLPGSDFNPLPGIMSNASQVQGPAGMLPAPPETPSLTNNRNLLAHPELVDTDQLIVIMRQAQTGLFVIPERAPEKQLH